MEVSHQFRWELPRLGGVKLGLAELMWCTEVSLPSLRSLLLL